MKMNEITLSSLKLVKQGAEAKIYEGVFCDKPVVAKERFCKTYRIKEIDNRLTKRRFNQEIRSLEKCRKNGIPTPLVYHFDKSKYVMYMEKLEGQTLKDAVIACLVSDGNYDDMVPTIRRVGQYLAQMHDASIIHGDLTTSNIMVSKDHSDEKGDSVEYNISFIDFGLSSHSTTSEDKGVDLYVLERAFLSTHRESKQLFEELLDSYQKYQTTKQDTPEIISKLDEVRMRGRKRVAFG